MQFFCTFQQKVQSCSDQNCVKPQEGPTIWLHSSWGNSRKNFMTAWKCPCFITVFLLFPFAEVLALVVCHKHKTHLFLHAAQVDFYIYYVQYQYVFSGQVDLSNKHDVTEGSCFGNLYNDLITYVLKILRPTRLVFRGAVQCRPVSWQWARCCTAEIMREFFLQFRESCT